MKVFSRRSVLTRAAVAAGGAIAGMVVVPSFASAAAQASGGASPQPRMGSRRPGASTPTSGAAWCSSDPEYTFKTPNGTAATVYVTVSAQGDVMSELQAAKIILSACAHALLNNQMTNATLSIAVPIPPLLQGLPFGYNCTVSSLPNAKGTIYASTSGLSGVPLLVSFQLPVA